ncbi:MAG: hypothetical protein ACTHJ0_06210 [Flavipsychrobacter sp.]
MLNPVPAPVSRPGIRNYIITNNLSTTVRVNIYKKVADYNTNSNLFMTCHLPGGSAYKISFNNLDTTATYYVDWFSDDYSNTNWLTFASNPSTMTPRSNDTVFLIQPPPHNGAYRSVVLSGYSYQTKWKAYDAYDYSYLNIWGAITANSQYRTLELNKDMTAVYTYKDAAGNIKTENYTFSFDYTGGMYIHGGFSPASSIDSFDNRSNLIASGPLPARDTIVLKCNDGLFMMAKQ